MKFNVPLGNRLLLLLCLFVFFYVIMNVGAGLFANQRFGDDSTAVTRIILVFQSLLAFIVPAIVTAVVITRYPAQLLAVNSLPSIKVTAIAVVTLIVAIPAIDVITQYNEALPLPDSIARIMQSSENAARSSVEAAIGPHNVMSFIVSFLILGVMAGLSEELFFRGALQRILTTGHANVHVAIWLTAVVFSGMHMQIYGFAPRLLLGVFFGYTLYWSGSLWLPIVLHIINNTIYLILIYNNSDTVRALPTGVEWLWVAISVILTVGGIYLLTKTKRKE